MYIKFFKRFFDIILSSLALIVLSPVLLVIAVLVRIQMGSPVIFSQERTGLNEKTFKLYKFRSMTDAKDENGKLLPNDKRLTKLGKFLRATSLDELFELVNIIKGDLSIVGPRALLPAYLPYYTDEERKRHSVRPGLTPPEVLYDDIMPTWEKQFEYEVHYAENVTLWMDIKIIFATFKGLFLRNNNDYGTYQRRPLSEERREKSVVRTEN